MEDIEEEYLKIRKKYYDVQSKKRQKKQKEFIGKYYKYKHRSLIKSSPDVWIEWFEYFSVDKISELGELTGKLFYFDKSKKTAVIINSINIGYKISSSTVMSKTEFKIKWKKFIKSIENFKEI